MYELITDVGGLPKVAQEIEAAPAVGLDIETTALRPWNGEIRLVQINTGQGVYIIDLFKTGTLGPVLDALKNGKAVKVVHNAKFEQRWFLHHYNAELWPLFDSFRASNLIYNGQQVGAFDLYSVYQRELDWVVGLQDMSGAGWAGELTEAHYRYASADVERLLDLRDVLRKKLLAGGLGKIALLEFGAVLPESSIENFGFHLDRDRWMAVAEKNIAETERIRKSLMAKMPSPTAQLMFPGIEPSWNLGSPLQVKKSLARMGLDLEDTEDTTLAMVAHDYPVVREFMSYRKVSKRVDSFGPEYLGHIDKTTGRIHTSFYPFTGAGRYASSDPNLQQIPRDQVYRECFTAPPGKKFVIADYSQIELRLVAEVSQDPVLMAIYKNGEDAHARTAAIVNEIDIKAVTKAQRQLAKPINFGLIYGLRPKRLVVYSQANYGVTMSLDQATDFYNKYFEGYQGVKRWHEKVEARDIPNRKTQTLLGRTRYLDETAYNEYKNTPIQGSGADGLKLALRNVYKRFDKYGTRARMSHMVHDEIVAECDDDPELIQAVSADLKGGMEEAMGAILKEVPVLAEPHVGSSWAEK